MAPIAATPDATSAPDPVAPHTGGRRRSWGLPLLAKELIELAVRPRTYQIRIAYAATLLLISFCVLVANVPSADISTVSSLGVGRPVLIALTILQELGLYVVLPILACSTLTTEKERQTLDLLLITKLGPWTIIFEKFLSQLIAAVNLLMLSLPLIAFSYALGGITPERLAVPLLELLLTGIRLTAIGVFCSAALRNTSQALLATYGLIVLTCFFEQGGQYLLLWVISWSQPPNATVVPTDLIELLTSQPGILALLRSNLILAQETDLSFPMRLLLGCLPSLAWSLGFVPLARWVLAPPVHGWLWWVMQFRWRGWQLIRRKRDLHDIPDNDPIAWREGPRENLTHWWVKRICLTGLPILVLLFALSWKFQNDDLRVVTVIFNGVIWIAITVRLCSHSATLLSPERVHQTLDLLCCSPMTGEEIMRQKMRRVWRLVHLSQVALIACLLFRSVYFPSLLYIGLSVITIGLFPPLIAWQSLTCGMKAKNGAGAILQSLLVIGAWCFIPFLLLFFFTFIARGGGGRGGLATVAFITSFSPLMLLGLTEAFPFPHRWIIDSEMIELVSIVSFMTIVVHGLKFAYLWDFSFREANVALRGAPEKLSFDLPSYRTQSISRE